MPIFLIIAAIISVSGCQAHTSTMTTAGRIAQMSSPIAAISGDDSHVREPLFARINSREELLKVWLRHAGYSSETIHSPTFEVDFRRCIVIAIFDGATVNTRGIRVESIAETDNVVTIRFEDDCYQTEVEAEHFPKMSKTATSSPQLPTSMPEGWEHVTPFAFIVVPRGAKTIVLEKNIQNILGSPPIWQEVARLN